MAPSHPPSNRCPLCRARMLEPTNRSLRYRSGHVRAFAIACASCGLLLDDRASLAHARADLLTRLETGRFEDWEDAAFGVDPYTARIAASSLPRRFVPDERSRGGLERPHGADAANGCMQPLETVVAVTLGVICRPVEVDAIVATLPDHAAWAPEIVIMADGSERAPERLPVGHFDRGAVLLGFRPLNGDFAGQRNAVQDMAKHAWVMQLDADETLSSDTAALLPALARMGEEEGVVSIGLARRNLVDGTEGDLFPDVQYRLNRKDVRYEGRVHERPERPWQRSTITLHGAIDHHLSRAHVLARSSRYEALSPGKGRLGESDALLLPYRD